MKTFRHFLSLFLLLFCINSYAIFTDGTCSAAASAQTQCVAGLPGPTWFVANGIGTPNLQYAVGFQNYGEVVRKALTGSPIDTIVVPSCFVMTTSCTNPWLNSTNTMLDSTYLSLTISSVPAPVGGNIVLANQSDSAYTLQAHPDFCSCGYYNGNQGSEYCSAIIKAINAGSPYDSIYNPQSPTPPFVPCASGSNELNAGFWVFNLVSPNGEIPPAGNYQTTVNISVEQTTS